MRQSFSRYLLALCATAWHLAVLASPVPVASADPWVAVGHDTPIRSTAEIPMDRLRSQTDRYFGTVFEGRFKFYRIYHNRETADIAAREQVIEGKTHFTARPIDQYLYVVQIQITPAQERWMRAHHIQRQDVIRARVRFAGIAPGGTLAFDLLEILQQ